VDDDSTGINLQRSLAARWLAFVSRRENYDARERSDRFLFLARGACTKDYHAFRSRPGHSGSILVPRNSFAPTVEFAMSLSSFKYDIVPIVLVGSMGVTTTIWNAFVGLQWVAPESSTMILALWVACAMTILLSKLTSFERLAEFATYVMLFSLYGMIALQLTYLTATTDLPLQDRLFAAADASLGLDWHTWTLTAFAHPFAIKVLVPVYESPPFQTLVLTGVLALCGPRGRNREFFTSMLLACFATTIISIAVPAFGPSEIFGIPGGWHAVLTELRSGDYRVPMPYIGIISFPSFHASMAVLFTAAVRGNRYLFVPTFCLNAILLIATVVIGYHYFVDVLAGVTIAFAALYCARAIYSSPPTSSRLEESLIELGEP